MAAFSERAEKSHPCPEAKHPLFLDTTASGLSPPLALPRRATGIRMGLPRGAARLSVHKPATGMRVAGKGGDFSALLIMGVTIHSTEGFAPDLGRATVEYVVAHYIHPAPPAIHARALLTESLNCCCRLIRRTTMSDPTPEPAPESPSSTVGDDTLIEGSEGVDLVARLCEATSLSKAEAQQYIEITGTLEGAMELYLDTQGRSGGGAAATAETDADASAHRSVSGSAAAAAAARPQKRSKVGDSDEDEGDESDPERVASDESEAFRTVSGYAVAPLIRLGPSRVFKLEL